MRQNYTISEEDWKKVMDLSREARSTPVIALSSADALSGRDFATLAHERVMDAWRDLGKKYGFKSDTVQPFNQKNREISAEKDEPSTK